MVPIFSILVVLLLSLLVTRVASVALMHTGLSIEAARFQARSAFTGVGYTTSESEGIVSHPVRRRIVSALMLVGNVGIITAMSSVMLSFIGMAEEPQSLYVELGVLLAGLFALWIFASSRWVDRWLCRVITWALARYSAIPTQDFTQLLHLKEDYSVNEAQVEEDSWLAGRKLRDARLGDEGVIVLGVECDGGNFIGAPPADTEIRAGDRLLLYGRVQRIAELDGRRGGAVGASAHMEASSEQDELTREELARAGR